MNTQNCWEFIKCGLEKECPAYPNNGRVCFSTTGTLCRGEIQGEYMDKIERCRAECEFYKMRSKEYTAELMAKVSLRDKSLEI